MTNPSPPDDDAIGKVYDARLMRRLVVYARPYGWLVVAALSCLILDGLMQLVGPLLTRRVIDVALPARDIGLVWRASILFAGSLVVGFACQYGETMLTSLLGQRVMRDLRRDIFSHVQRLPVVFFDRNPVGRLVTRVTSDVEALNELFTAGVVAGLGDLFTLLAISALMLATDWRLALASCRSSAASGARRSDSRSSTATTSTHISGRSRSTRSTSRQSRSSRRWRSRC